ncbi:28S ribosomal protein S5, mitochondrial [Portunus trituberculatus]|uniref:28S ribosomal protein S5, mitochondrial n=1 Tax=Portunus trituberculatus TaxID=210409 RepID=A0A5B7IWR7_PORTR|nr:28S ribosomal protein S5, mitochondrial [Portunus trituberculatus]
MPPHSYFTWFLLHLYTFPLPSPLPFFPLVFFPFLLYLFILSSDFLSLFLFTTFTHSRIPVPHSLLLLLAVLHDFFTQYGATKIYVKKMPEGYGLVCHRAIRTMCQVVGIKDIHAKVEGTCNVQNMTKAFFLGLMNQVCVCVCLCVFVYIIFNLLFL